MAQTKFVAGDSVAPMGFTGGDDGTIVLQTGAAGSKVNAVSYAADGTPTFLKIPINTAVQSMVRVDTSNGYGSTNTPIRRFTNVRTNQGSDITYADSATLGASFTIITNGVYAISYSDSFASAQQMGISLNSSQLTTALISINASDTLAAEQTPASGPACVAVTAYLVAGSVIRPHSASNGTGTSVGFFTIVRVA